MITTQTRDELRRRLGDAERESRRADENSETYWFYLGRAEALRGALELLDPPEAALCGEVYMVGAAGDEHVCQQPAGHAGLHGSSQAGLASFLQRSTRKP